MSTRDVSANSLRSAFPVPGREYVVSVEIELSDAYVAHVFGGGGGSSSTNTRYSLESFYGDAYRSSGAKATAVGEGKDAGGLDIMIHLAEMRAVSGTVLEAGSGSR